jgi:hypothetical protein
MTTKTESKRQMNQGFAVFNLHVNNAGKRADVEYIAQFGQEHFDEHIAPAHAAGIMTIFTRDPIELAARLPWITLVTAYVNENRTEES